MKTKFKKSLFHYLAKYLLRLGFLELFQNPIPIAIPFMTIFWPRAKTKERLSNVYKFSGKALVVSVQNDIAILVEKEESGN